MTFKPIGYDFVPFRSPTDPADVRPINWFESSPTTVYADDSGRSVSILPTDEGVFALPYIPGSPAKGPGGPLNEQGGFVPLDKMPKADEPKEADFGDMLAGMMQQMGPQMASQWLGQAAAQSIVAGGVDGVMDSALKVLGVANPLASGPLAAILGGALKQAGVGELGSLLPSAGAALMGGSTAGLANAMGAQGVRSLLGAAGLGDIPGAGLITNFLGNQIGDALQDAFTGGLDNLTGDLSSSLSDLSVDNIVASTQNQLGNIDVNAIGSNGLDMAADELMSAWKVDDESSAAEHIAKDAIKKHKDEIKGVLKDELLGGKGGGLDGLYARIAKFFNGEKSEPGKLVIRMGDTDKSGDVSMTGIANILVEKQPVSVIKGMVVGPKAPPPGKAILQGMATVLSAEQQTAFVGAAVAVPCVMSLGAKTVYVGGAVASIKPPKAAPPPIPQGNGGPAAPQGPQSTGSASNSSGDAGQGSDSKQKQDDSVSGNQQPSPKGDEASGDKKKPSTIDAPDLPGAAEDGLGKAEEAARKNQSAKVDEELKQQRADAEQKAADADAKATDQRGVANEAAEKAKELERVHQEQLPARNAAEYRDAQLAAQQAGQARGEANELDKIAKELEVDSRTTAESAQKLPRGVGDLPSDAPELKLGGILEPLAKAAKYAGPAGDIIETGIGVYNMNQYGNAGEDREVVREAGGTIGNLLGGAAGAGLGAAGVAFVVGTGGLGLIAIGAGAIVGGMLMGSAGEAAGAAAGDAYADKHGIENQSGSKEPNKGVQFIDNLSQRGNSLYNSVTNWW